jgi:dsRNA-specific ribonuclease
MPKSYREYKEDPSGTRSASWGPADKDSSDSEEHKSVIPSIYNENNILIELKQIEDIINKFLSKKTKVKVQQEYVELYRTALTHKSYIKNAYVVDKEAVINPLLSFIPKKKKYVINVEFDQIKKKKNVLELRKKSYERLEFLGDSIIHYILGDYLFHRFVDDDEGLMTKIRTKLENGGIMSVLSKAIGLTPFILLAKQIEITKGREIISILEDTFEAFIGAMHEEFGIETCREFVINVIEDNIDITELLEIDDNYKDQLLRYYHKMKWPNPKYTLVDTIIKEENNSRTFKVIIKDSIGKIIGNGMGGSLRKAEQLAAKTALEYLFKHVKKINLERNTKDV